MSGGGRASSPVNNILQESLTDYYARRLTFDNYGTTPNPEIGGGSGFDTYMVYHWETFMVMETEDVYGAPLNAMLGDVPRIRTGVIHARVVMHQQRRLATVIVTVK